jgi:putative endopeptidase
MSVNQRWQNSITLPPTETRITQAYFIGREINRELATIIHAQKTGIIADMLASWRVAEDQRYPEGLTPILLMLLNTTGSSAISGAIGWLNRNGFDAPLSVYTQGDPRDHDVCRVFIDIGTPGIGIPEYWTWREYSDTRAAYQQYVDSLADTLGLPIIKEGLEAERDFCKILPNEDRRERRINMLTWSELRRQFSIIDWTALFVNYGIPEERLSSLMFNVTAPGFLHKLQTRMDSVWSVTQWQGWLSLFAAQRIAGISPYGPLRTAWFAYARRFLQGMPRDEDVGELRMAVIRTLLPNTLGKLWVHLHCPADLRRHIHTMVEHIRTAAMNAIRHTSWMASSTRKAAIEKLRRMDVCLCWPEPWNTIDISCDLSQTDFVENLLAIAGHATDESLKQLKYGCRKSMLNGWPRPVYDVNAYYYPEENRFVLPASILRPPFYDSTKSKVWNYGAIGATIGHELCHAFDSEGRHYDSHGDKHKWWSDRDDREYRIRSRRVVELYESRRYRGMKVNGKLTLVENIADLGGLEFALAGVARELGRPLTRDEIREFFTSYTVSWRAKDRHARARELLTVDPHSPPLLRVNHAVRQFDEWYEAFDIDASCPDYIPAEKRIRFFR